MYFDWSSVFSIFNAPNFSRTVGGSESNDARNIKLPGISSFRDLSRTPHYGRRARIVSNAISSVQGLRTEALASTSASIVEAGLNKVWSNEPKAPILPSHGHTPRVPSVPLQNAANLKQPGTGIIHTPGLGPISPQPAVALTPTRLPCPKASQLDSELLTAHLQPGSGSVVLSSFLHKVANEEHPKREILHPLKLDETFGCILQPTIAPTPTHLPSAQTRQPEREPFTSDLQHPSGSRFLSFSLQKIVKPEQGIIQPPNSRTFSTVPQTPAVPLLCRLPSAKASQTTTKQNTSSFPHAWSPNATQKQCSTRTNSSYLSSESRFPQSPPTEQQPRLGITPVLSPKTLEHSNDISLWTNIASPGSSLAKHSERNAALNLSATGQDSFCLPSVSYPQSTSFNLFPNTFPPLQSLLFLPPTPIKKFNFNPFSPEEDSVSLPPSPKPKSQLGIAHPVRGFDYTINMPRGRPMSPTQVAYLPLSPLSIALLPSPWSIAPPPNELNIKITGPADHHRPHVTHFLLSRGNEVANSLVVVWGLSHADSGGARGMMSLKALFAQLNETILGSDSTALSCFTKLSITIPHLVKDVTPHNDPLGPVKEDNSIDLANAMDLLEFSWHGDFVVFASKIKNLSFATLTVLNVASSYISIEDAVTLLHSCPDLQTASMGTIDDCDAMLSFQHTVRWKELPNLNQLALESVVALDPFFTRFRWHPVENLILTLRRRASETVTSLWLPSTTFPNITLNGHLNPRNLSYLRIKNPDIIYHDIGIDESAR